VRIAPGAKISSGTVIQLFAGDGSLSTLLDVPDLVGLNVETARSLIESSGFVVGTFYSNSSIQDTASAFVIAQSPFAFSEKLDSLNMPIKNRVPIKTAINLTIDITAPIRESVDTIKN